MTQKEQEVNHNDSTNTREEAVMPVCKGEVIIIFPYLSGLICTAIPATIFRLNTWYTLTCLSGYVPDLKIMVDNRQKIHVERDFSTNSTDPKWVMRVVRNPYHFPENRNCP